MLRAGSQTSEVEFVVSSPGLGGSIGCPHHRPQAPRFGTSSDHCCQCWRLGPHCSLQGRTYLSLLWPKSQPRLFPNPRVFLTFISWTMSPMVSWSTCAGHACYAAGRLQGLLGGATAMQEEEEGLYRR